MDAALAAR